MNILIVGCGKVGSRLAESLSQDGHDISIVDQEEAGFDNLPEDFPGVITTGVPIDQDVLRKAGIESCDALAAVSHDDTTNIMVSQVAKQVFQVPTIICRIYDPKLEDVFTRFGIHTICPTNLTVASVKSALSKSQSRTTMNIGSHAVTFLRHPVPKAMYDMPLEEVECGPGISVFGIEHADCTLTLAGTKPVRLRAGDTLVLAQIVD